MKNGREPPLHVHVDELDLLLLVKLVPHRRFQIGVLRGVDEIFVLHVEGRGEVDIFLVLRIPEMIVRCGDDLVESGRALAIAVDFHHCGKVVGCNGLIGRVDGDVGGDLASHGSSCFSGCRKAPGRFQGRWNTCRFGKWSGLSSDEQIFLTGWKRPSRDLLWPSAPLSSNINISRRVKGRKK